MRILATILALFLMTNLAHAQPHLYGEDAEFRLHSTEKLSKVQRDIYRKFKTGKSYFGAFFIEPGTNAYFFIKGAHDYQAALRAAEYGCAFFTEGQGPKCVLYASIAPKGMTGFVSEKNALGLPAWSIFVNEYLQGIKAKSGHAAYAISGLNHYGYGYGFATARDARAAALDNCNGVVLQSRFALPEEARKWAKRNGLDTCRIVDER